MAAQKEKRQVRFTKLNIAPVIKAGGTIVVSEALVKKGAVNLIPKCHVKRGDTVVLISGPKKEDKKRSAEDTKSLQLRNAFKGTIGKVKAVYPRQGKVIVEGVNMMLNAEKARTAAQAGGLVRREAPLAISKVMLYDTTKKKAVRSGVGKRKEANLS